MFPHYIIYLSYFIYIYYNKNFFDCQIFDNRKIFWYYIPINGGETVIKLDYSLQTPEERNELV